MESLTSELNTLKQPKNEGVKISLPLLMSESRSCPWASPWGSWCFTQEPWVGSGRSCVSEPKATIQTLSVPSGTALERERGARWQAEKAGRYGSLEHYERSIHCILVIVHRWKEYHSVCSDRSAPSHCTCTPRHYASCLHVFKKLSLAKMDWSAHMRTCARAHTHNFQYFLPPMGVYAVPQKKKIFVRITHILENPS